MNRSRPTFQKFGIFASLAFAHAVVLLLSSSTLASGQTWTLTSAPITNWVSVACSADGQHLIAAANNNGGPLYVSTDGGATWKQTSAPWTNWTCVAGSADGTELVAAGNYTPVYFSSDGGVTWRNSTNIGPWRSVACSSDGTTMLAAGNDFPMVASGSCFSTNSGASWVSGNGGPWLATSTSAQGSKLAIAGHFYIYQHGLLSEVLISADHGASWADATNAPTLPWAALSLSSDGSKLIALASGAGAVSQDLGDTWTTISTPNVLWTSLATSKDCGKVIAAGSPSPLYTSLDGGSTWISNSAPVANWSGVASSADGNTLVAAVNGGGIYTWHAPAVVPGTVLWTYDAALPIVSSPTVANDGTIYVGTPAGLFAITNSGAIASCKWVSPSPPVASASIDPDGTIYYVDSAGNLVSLNPTGTTNWSYVAGGGGGTPAIGADGTIYFQGYTGLLAVSPAGNEKWRAAVGDQGVFCSPAIGPDGTIYMTSSEFSKVYAVNPDGSTKWVYDLPSKPGAALGIQPDAGIDVCGGSLYAFSFDGKASWSAFGNPLDGLPVLDQGGTTYVAGYQSHVLYAFSAGGQLRWQALGFGSLLPSTAVAVDSGGTIYYSIGNSVTALSPTGTVEWTVSYPNPEPGLDMAITSPTIGSGGTIYAAIAGTLYAIATGTNGPANSSWPMYQQNARHTGKIERPFLALPQKGTGSAFTFQLYPNQLGLTYSIETSTNLTTWTTLTNVLATTLPTDVVDFSSSNAPARFYRASGGQ